MAVLLDAVFLTQVDRKQEVIGTLCVEVISDPIILGIATESLPVFISAEDDGGPLLSTFSVEVITGVTMLGGPVDELKSGVSVEVTHE